MASGGLRVKAVFDVVVRRLQDVDKLRRKMEQMQSSTGRARDAMGRFVSENNRAARSVSVLGGGMKSLIGQFTAIAGAVGGARAAMALWNASVGEAMRNEMNQNALAVQLGDSGKTADMNKFIKERQINSAYSLADWQAGAKGLAPILKDNIPLMKKTLDMANALAMSDPTRGFDDAIFSIREALSSDYISLQERFSIPRSVIKDFKAIADSKGLKGVAKDAWVVEKALEKMGYNQEFVNAQMNTTLGQWLTFKNRVKNVLLLAGEQTLKYLKPLFESFNNWLDADRIDEVARKLGRGLAYIINGFIDLGKDIWKFFKSDGFKEFMDDIKATLKPVASRFKDWLDLLKEAWQVIRNDVLPAMSDLNKALGDQETAIGKVWNVLAPFLTTLLMVKGLGAIGKKLGLDKVFKNIAKGIGFVFGGAMIGKLGKFGKVFGRVGRMLGKGGQAALLFRTGMRLLSKAFAATGWGVIISILIEIGFWIYDNWNKIKKWAGEVKGGFIKAWDKVKEKWGEVKKWWNDLVDNIMQSNFVKTIREWWDEDGEYIISRWDAVKKAASKAWTGIKEGWADFAKAFKEDWAEIKKDWNAFWDPIMEKLKPIFDWLSSAWATISTKVQEFKDFVQPILDEVQKQLENLANAGLAGILDVLTGIVAFITGDFEEAKKQFTEAWDNMKKAGEDAVNGIWEKIKEVFEPLAGWFGEKMKAAETAFDTFGKNVLGFLQPVLNIVNNIKDSVDSVKTKLSNLKVPELSMPSWLGGGDDGSHRFGRAFIPHNNYSANLHRGERVLTAKENKEYSDMKYHGIGSGGVQIGSLANTLVVREDADIDKIAKALARELARVSGAGA